MTVSVYLLGTSSGRWYGPFLRWWQDYEYTHVGYISDLRSFEDFTVIDMVYSIRQYEYDQNKEKDRFYTIFQLDVSEDQKERIDSFLTRKLRERVSYDWAGLLGLLLRTDLEKQTRFFCSELVYSALSYAGVHLLRDIPAYKVTPACLLRSPLLKVLFDSR